MRHLSELCWNVEQLCSERKLLKESSSLNGFRYRAFEKAFGPSATAVGYNLVCRSPATGYNGTR